MNGILVSSIKFPNNYLLDVIGSDCKREVRDFPDGIADIDIVNFVIDIMGEVVDAVHSDFSCNGSDGVYFKLDDGRMPMELVISIDSLRHILAFPPVIKGIETWMSLNVVKKLLINHPNLLATINQKDNWLDKVAEIIHNNYKNEIINHECSSINAGIEKLNWQKMAIKMFSFINLGLLEDGKVLLYEEKRNKYSMGNKTYILVKSLRNGDLEDSVNFGEDYYDKQIYFQLVEELFNGKKILTPKSLLIVDKPLKGDKSRAKLRTINVGNSEYIFKSNVVITRMRGSKYANKR